MELRELSTKIQIKLHQFSERFCSDFSRPERKFLYQMLFGLLKGGKVQLNSIARHLQDGLSLKKSTERLKVDMLGLQGCGVGYRPQRC
ncbi:MAG: hypothetical protein O7G31_12925 [Calditrichaeota bacterium]|nr:hypothetical protein [Calditrichota bacterium]